MESYSEVVKDRIIGCVSILILICIVMIISNVNRYCDIKKMVVIDIYKIAKIESSNNQWAISKSGAIGLCQVKPIVLEEFNKYNHKNYPVYYLYLYDCNLEVANWYVNERIPQMLKAYKIEDTIDNRLMAYNWGAKNLSLYLSGVCAINEEAENYLIKYKGVAR